MSSMEYSPAGKGLRGERVGFDVRISSMQLAFTSIRRVYLNCARQLQSNKLFYRGQKVADKDVPDFNILKQQAAFNPLYSPPPLAIFR